MLLHLYKCFLLFCPNLLMVKNYSLYDRECNLFTYEKIYCFISGENGACPPTQDGSIHPFLMREAA